MKKMKYTVYILTLLFLVSCKNFKGYTINGTVKNGENLKVYLEDIASNDLAIMDTTTVVNGKFHLKNYAPQGLYRLRMGDQNVIFLYIRENDKIEITTDVAETYNYSVKGSEDCQVIKDFTTELSRQLSEQDSLYSNAQTAPVNAKDSMMVLLKGAQDNYVAYIKQFVSSTPNKEIAAFALNFLGPAMQQEIPYLIAVTDSLHKAEPESKFINRWYTSLQQYRDKMLEGETTGIAVGATAPNIVLPNPNGDTISLKSLQGKYVLLDFWASWCGPCREENPNVVRLYKKFHPKGLEIFSVSLDSNESPWLKAIKADGLIWPYHVSDLKGWGSLAAKAYSVEAIPQTYLLDRTGKVIAKNLRGELLEQKLDEIFKEEIPAVN